MVELPKNWSNLTEQEQKDWIDQQIEQPKVPIPMFQKEDKVNEMIIKTSGGLNIRLPSSPITISKKNPNLEQLYYKVAGKWIITAFKDKTQPFKVFISLCDGVKRQWLVQEGSFEVLAKLIQIFNEIGFRNKFFNHKKRKSRR